MQTAPLVIPRHIVQQRFRPPKKNIPQTPIQRNHILQVVRNYVAEHSPVPPLPVEELKVHAELVVKMLNCDPLYCDYIGVLINNEMWRETLASVPYERRLLLLPKCLRVESKCPAPFDEFGLLCKQCGLCTIQDLQTEAEKLGYAVLVAEGSAIVMSLIQTGKIEAIVGVSCLSVLERAFPYMEAAAIPGVAIPLLQDIRKVALAVECFHRASLIHDDIEDNDAMRYGEKTLHEEHGVAVALNVGDLLIGEGYRLIGAGQASAEQKAEMLLIASQGQRQLCRGQGAELCWARTPRPLTQTQVLDIFRKKTAPAFEVALRLGALYAGIEQHEEVADALANYSEALGIAYQIRDDLSDLGSKGETNDIAGLRPSLLLAVAYEKAKNDQKAQLESVWCRSPQASINPEQIEALYTELKADERARQLYETYKEE